MLPPDEPRVSLKAICSHPLFAKDGRPLSLASAYRYVLTGVKVRSNGYWIRIKLGHERGPRGTVSSPQAVERFIRALNGDVEPPAENAVVAKQLAAAELDAIGI